MSTIFIVGSSSGIGKATAKLFAEKGWTVIAAMRSPEKETELTSYGNKKELHRRHGALSEAEIVLSSKMQIFCQWQRNMVKMPVRSFCDGIYRKV